MKKITLALVAAFALSGCVGTMAAIGGAVSIGAAAYCVGVSNAGKNIVRDAATNGKQVIYCD